MSSPSGDESDVGAGDLDERHAHRRFVAFHRSGLVDVAITSASGMTSCGAGPTTSGWNALALVGVLNVVTMDLLSAAVERPQRGQ
jgi:hypothetical protein